MREVDATQKCFICDIRKEQFDQAGIDVFRNHIASQHNMWTYLQFMIFLWEQDQDDDDGLQQYVRRCLRTGDLTWFPSHNSLVLQSHKRMQQEEFEDNSDLKEVEERLQKQIKAKHAAMTQQIENLTQMVLQLSEGGIGGGGGRSGAAAGADIPA